MRNFEELKLFFRATALSSCQTLALTLVRRLSPPAPPHSLTRRPLPQILFPNPIDFSNVSLQRKRRPRCCSGPRELRPPSQSASRTSPALFSTIFRTSPLIALFCQVSALPIVLDAHTLIKSNEYTSFALAKVEQISTSLLNLTQPLQDRLPISTANAYANDALTYVEKRVPAVKTVNSEEIRNQATSIAKAYTDQLHSVRSRSSSPACRDCPREESSS